MLDVGAGPGKFCMVAANEVRHSTFVGIELRPYLVRTAKRLAARHSIENVQFLVGDALDLDWSRFDAFYFYNPFAEHLHQPAFALDQTIEADPAKFVRYMIGVRQRLLVAKPGARVVTYHGFGARVPYGYELVEKCVAGSGQLELWIKTRAIDLACAPGGES